MGVVNTIQFLNKTECPGKPGGVRILGGVQMLVGDELREDIRLLPLLFNEEPTAALV